MYNRCWDI
jgi:hypothetical protein